MLTGIRARADVRQIASAFAVLAAMAFFPTPLAAQTPTLTVTPTTVSPGGTVTVTVANGPGNALDWVGMFPSGAGDSGYLPNWVYVSGSRTVPPSATRASASRNSATSETRSFSRYPMAPRRSASRSSA